MDPQHIIALIRGCLQKGVCNSWKGCDLGVNGLGYGIFGLGFGVTSFLAGVFVETDSTPI